MGDKSRASMQSRSKPRRNRPFWRWALQNPGLLLSRHPLAQMAASDETILISVYGRQEQKFQLCTKLDSKLSKSIITKEKADSTEGTIVALSPPMEFKDSAGITYSTRSSITLRWQYGGVPQSFNEIFYIVDSCNFDVIFRSDIPRSQLKDEKRCFPLLFGRKTQAMTQDQSNTQKEATLQADERDKKITEEDKAKDWQDQPKLKKKDNKVT